MIQRSCNPPKNHSFFLFGPRGVGKSTFLEKWFEGKSVTTIDLLDPILFQRYSLHPNLLLTDWKANPTEWIFIDEIQKIPALLDVIQKQMRKGGVLFALTGSSARKLRRGASNLLGGRAFELHMHPFTHLELDHVPEGPGLKSALSWGTLPHLLKLDESSKVKALYSYITTYLREEVLVEQVIRKMEPFQKFLEVAAQMNGKILNYAKIARDSGVEERSVARYFQILDDTLIGFHLYPYSKSLRKQQAQKAKFYFFDPGVVRALQNKVTLPLQEHTNSYGDLFEQYIILEFIRLNDYLEKHYRFSYFRSKEGVEIDLIIERPGLPDALVEIKSKDYFDQDDAKNIEDIGRSFKKKDMFLLSNCPTATLRNNVHFCHWKEGIKKIFCY